MPEKLAVDTASHGNSVWQDVGWNDFRNHIVALQRASNEVPGDPLVHSAAMWQATHQESNNTARTLPFDVEQRLADDIAFLAADEEGPRTVSAVALEEHHEPEGLTVRLAANQSISQGVQDTLKAMFDLLGQCSSRKLSRDVCRDSLFDLVMSLSQNRIHGRLQSVHWVVPKSRVGGQNRKPLHLGLLNVVMGIEGLQGVPIEDKKLLQSKMRHLCDLLERVDRCGKSTAECGRLLSESVKNSHDICTSAGTATLEETLRHYGMVESELSDIKHIRQIDKIGRYWGMCFSMTEDSRKYGNIFANVQLETLCPYQAKTSEIAFTEGRKARCHVHAEIQILVFYSMMPNVALRKPRVIGVSKSACYLCNLFIHEHRQFFITKTHGRLYERWNFPNLDDFDPGERVRLRRSLTAVDREVQAALVTAEKGRFHPMGSWLTLPPARQVSPVPSTVRSVASKGATKFDECHSGPSIADVLDESSLLEPQSLPKPRLTLTQPQGHAASLTDEASSSLSSGSKPSGETPAHRDFTAAAPSWITLGGMTLIFEADGATQGSVVIARTPDCKDMTAKSIDVDTLEAGEIKEFVREAKSENIVLRLNLSRGQSFQLTLSWPGISMSDASRTT